MSDAATALLQRLRANGIELEAGPGGAVYFSPPDLPPARLAEVQSLKPELHALLSSAADTGAPSPPEAAAILRRVREAGADLRLDPGGTPRMVRAPRIAPALQAEVRAHRAEPVELLQAEEAALPDGPALIRATLAAEARRKAEVAADPAPLPVDDVPEARCDQCGDTFAPLRPGDRHCEICQPFAGPFAALEPSPEFLAKFFRCETCRVTVYAPARPARLLCRECARAEATAAGAVR